MKLRVLDHTYCVCRLNAEDTIPTWINKEHFWSITRTQDELSLVCQDHPEAQNLKSERGWKIMRVEGTLDFSLTGVLASILTPLAENKISIFALSTYDTDYILVKEEKLTTALEALAQAGFI